MALLLAPGGLLADTEIYRCTDEDGGIVFSQTPCEQHKKAEDKKAPDADVPAESEQYDAVAAEAAEPDNRSAEEVATCKQHYRDAIDAIDSEIARDYSEEKSEEYKQRLLALTKQLRNCR